VQSVSHHVFMYSLLEMYLHPGDGRAPMHAAAVRLLHCHGASLDPLKVLEVSPGGQSQLAYFLVACGG
jgi:hypothetical protein